MKFTKYLLILFALCFAQISCDDGFAELNTNPNAANEINPDFQFSYVQLYTSGERYENWRAMLIYSSVMIQHFATTCSYWNGDKYTYNAGYSSSLFDRNYTSAVKNIQDLINTLQNQENPDPARIGMARIWRVVLFHRLTDMYGDVPYSEAGKGFLEGIDLPKYDAQSDIYTDMLNELSEAVAQLGSGGEGFGDADFVYGGDIDQWRRFGNSMMLRLGMRMSEVDATAAQGWVTKAIAGGVLESNADDAFITHTNGPEGINMNGIGEVLDLQNGSGGDDCPRLSATLADWMKNTGDPRLDVLGVLPVNGTEHNGMPNGLDETTIQNNPTGTSADDFSDINPLIVRVSSPMMFMTYAEVEFMLAEAILRNWHNGDAATHYENGVRAAMKMWEHYDASLAIADAAIDTYLANNPFDGTMSQIGWQYWAATILNEYEAFSNWRRTGYPDLVPVNYPGNVTNGQIPLRLALPQSEAGVNAANFNEAASRQGLPTDFGSHLAIPVWWDK